MKKTILLLLPLLFASILFYGADNPKQEKINTPNQQKNDPSLDESSGSEDVANHDVSPKSDSRWYKSREGRAAYRQGGSDVPRQTSRPDESNPDNLPSKNDDRWNRNR